MKLTDVIRRPLITEKTTTARETTRTVVFEVAKDANKIDVRRAVEKLLGSKVEAVRTAVAHGKFKRQGKFIGQRSDWKKAYVKLKDGEVVHITAKNFSISTLDAADVSPVIDTVTWKIEDADLNGSAHFMEKEIFEQPVALENTMRGRFSEDGSTAQFGGFNVTPVELRQVDRFGHTAQMIEGAHEPLVVVREIVDLIRHDLVADLVGVIDPGRGLLLPDGVGVALQRTGRRAHQPATSRKFHPPKGSSLRGRVRENSPHG